MKARLITVATLMFKWNDQYYIAKIVSTLIFLYLLYGNLIDPYLLVRSFIILLLLASYKWCLMNLGNDDSIVAVVHAENKIRIKMFNRFDDLIISKRLYLIKSIYNVLYYFPTNGFYLLILWGGRKCGVIRLYINSYKDKIGQKYFGKNGSNFKSPLNSKKAKFLRKYIYDPIFRILYLTTYFKINLISLEGGKFFQYRLIGAIYGVVLITYNLSIIGWFKTTSFIGMSSKILLLLVIIYCFLFYFYPYVLKKAIPIFDLLEEYIIKLHQGQLTYKFKYKYALKKVLANIEALVNQPTLRMYYKTEDYLIFMSLANYFEFFINFKYNIFLVKHTDKHNKKLPSNLSLLAKLSYADFEYDNYVWDFVEKYSDMDHQKYMVFKKNSNFPKNNNYQGIDYVWLFEKLYSVPVHAYLMSHSGWNGVNITNIYINYDIYSILYGNQLVENIFGLEIQQIEDHLFIHGIMEYVFVNHLKINAIISDILNGGDVLLSYGEKTIYRRVLEMCDFYVYNPGYKARMLDYYTYFETKTSVFHMQIIFSDIKRYRKQYGYDLAKFIQYGTKNPNVTLQDEFMQMRIEIFKIYNNCDHKVSNLKIKIDSYIMQHVNHLQIDEIIDLIMHLQQEFADKHTKNPMRLKSNDFMDKYAVLPKGEYFAKLEPSMRF